MFKSRSFISNFAHRKIHIPSPESRPENGFPIITQSYCHALSNSTIEPLTIGQALLNTANVRQDKTASIFHAEKTINTNNNAELTYNELLTATGRFADGLLKLGLKCGDKVAMWAPNIKEWPIVQFGLPRAGLVIVTLNPLYSAAELEYALKKSNCKAIICPTQLLDSNNYSKILNSLDYDLMKIVIQSEILKTETVIPDINDSVDFYQVLESGDENSSSVSSIRPDTDDLAMIQFTSGTTGKPKAAGLTHNNIVNNARFCADRANLSENSILQVNVPLFHCFSNVLGSVGAMVTGTPMIYPNHSWNARHAIESISEHKTTIMYGTPTMYIDMLREIDNNPGQKFDFSSLEHSVCGASIMPTQIINRCQQEFNSTVLNWFGTTENSPLVSACYVNDRLDKVQTTIGRPLAHTEAKIVDDNGKILPVNTTGELCTRGYQVFLGYLGDGEDENGKAKIDSEKTSEAIDASRWYHSGDTAQMDNEGYIRIIGRNKDMINRGGENVYPSEIENVLIKHDQVVDAQVIGAPDSRLGEVVAVYLKVKNVHKEKEPDFIDELKKFSGKELAGYKIPKHWKIVEDYPLTLSGKVKKFELRDWSIKDFDLRI